MKFTKTLAALAVSAMLTACGGGGNVAPLPAPAPGNNTVTSDMNAFLTRIGAMAASDLGVTEGYDLRWDLIDRAHYQLEYAKIPPYEYILGRSWDKVALVNTEVWPNKLQVAETIAHELQHVKQREDGYTLWPYRADGTVVIYRERWYEVEAKCAGFRWGNRWAETEGVNVPQAALDEENYWCSRVAQYPRPLPDYGYVELNASLAKKPTTGRVVEVGVGHAR